MSTINIFLIGLFLMITISWSVMMIVMRKTTGELKLFITPNNLVKLLAIITVVIGVIILADKGIMNIESVGAILAGIIGYTLGTNFGKEK